MGSGTIPGPVFAGLRRPAPGERCGVASAEVKEVASGTQSLEVQDMCRIAPFALAILVMDATSVGQIPFARLTKMHLPVDDDGTLSVCLGDVDGDRDLDILATTGLGENKLYLNNGQGLFRDATTQIPQGQVMDTSCALGDVDGDGDLDAVLGAYSNPNKLWLNNGVGVFTDASASILPRIVHNTQSVLLVDVDNDGDLDLVVGNSGTCANPCIGEQDQLFLNDGRGRFQNATATNFPGVAEQTLEIAAGDVDRDGDLDLLFANTNVNTTGVQNLIWLNDGGGRFTDATSTNLPQAIDHCVAVALADVDLDGDLDAFFGTSNFTGPEQDKLYLNDGRGRFSIAPPTALPTLETQTRQVVFCDVDFDGDPDLIAAQGGANRWLLNDGQGKFSPAASSRFPLDLAWSHALAVGDVDGDIDQDIVFASDGLNQLYLNEVGLRFVDATLPRFRGASSRTTTVLAGDIDGDGDPDLFLGNGGDIFEDYDLFYMNDGSGIFRASDRARLPRVKRPVTDAAFGDVDGDGDIDLVMTTSKLTGGNTNSSARQNRLYVNDGKGIFSDATASALPAILDETRAVVLADFDGDGDLDLFFGMAV